jgi:hypothetical protein
MPYDCLSNGNESAPIRRHYTSQLSCGINSSSDSRADSHFFEKYFSPRRVRGRGGHARRYKSHAISQRRGYRWVGSGAGLMDRVAFSGVGVSRPRRPSGTLRGQAPSTSAMAHGRGQRAVAEPARGVKRRSNAFRSLSTRLGDELMTDELSSRTRWRELRYRA